ncbi:hypothetical protein CFP71_38230 [Amycolatopsis thailandensis]|uniref:ATPase n=1 Tax=Amycolatopsis thailandensis TaxID=589330 RepID=A0A229RH57_9PSEU|nr:SRPBCC family protein [Amycolatopsis thailandensis]OXM45754.1 hypothetical protein CFP71_38230 [Amycolatopsis thailandensis]
MSFTTSFTVDRTPQQVFDAFTDVRRWWSEEIEHAGDEFEYHYEEVHRCRVRVTESVPGRKVTWLVPEYECFDVCHKAWTFYVGTSLRDLITTGEGQPNRRNVLPAEPAR